ncbi:MAG TPA: FtsK/SpoIIIE domain-containing protein [Chthoniobacter sp.]
MSNSDIRPSHVLELLASLQKTAAAFAQREADLNRELSGRRHNLNRQHRESVDKTEGRLSSQIEESNATCQTGRERLTGRYEGRRMRSNRAGTAALRKLPLRARQHKERWMGDLQLKQFQTEKKLEADQKASDGVLKEVTKQLDDGKERMDKVRQRARRASGGFYHLQRYLRPTKNAVPVPAQAMESVQEMQNGVNVAEQNLAGLLKRPVAVMFGYLMPALLFPLLLIGAFVLAAMVPGGQVLAAAVGGVLLLLVILYAVGAQQAKALVAGIGNALNYGAVHHAAATASATAQNQRERARAQEECDATKEVLAEQWNRSDQVEVEYEQRMREKIETQMPRISAQVDQYLQPKLARLVALRDERQAKYRSQAESQQQALNDTYSAESNALTTEEITRWDALANDWHRTITPLYEKVRSIQERVTPLFPPWTESFLESWATPKVLTDITRFGQLDTTIANHPQDSRLPLPGPAQVSLPLALAYPQEGSLLFETRESGDATINGTLNDIILRLFTTSPPGKIAFSIIDPVGLGQSFAGLMHFSDYEEALINRRIWTQRDQIDERLVELNEHIEKVIQMYLRNEYATITEYNEQAGSVAEKYHFLVVADFPANFSETAAKRLQSIATSGARCGVFTLIHWDTRQEMPDGFVPDELRKSSILLKRGANGEFVIAGAPPEAAARLIFDGPPPDELAAQFVHKIGKASIDSNRVEVPFSQIAPPPGELWTNETTSELKVAIGRTGATKHQMLSIGKGTRQHALFAGKTGSGKSTLFHVIITNLALSCSPEQVEFYLIDFKKGVEFKCYAEKKLPHARVVAIESDREFALSVLQKVDDELKRRGDMFRKLGVQDVGGYKRSGGTEPMPRALLIIDEFQEFFVEDDTIAQGASLLFDRIVRQGRAFGIHVLLGSQTLGGAYSLARATLGQMVIRVALQCNEADAYLIMDDTNSAPRLLSRPGEGIYNDAAGAVEGNSPFQVVWLSDKDRDDRLDEISDLVVQRHLHYPSPIVFEGNAPAAISENDPLEQALEKVPTSVPGVARAWFGAPNSIKGPTEATFQRQSGNHLLIVGQRDEAALTMLGVSLLSIAAQYPVGTARFILIQSTTPGSSDAELLDRIVASVPHPVTVSRGPEIPQIMADLTAEMKARSTGEAPAGAPTTFVLIHGLHRFKKLRQEDDFSFSMSGEDAGGNPGAQFAELITEGSTFGIHMLVSIDTFNNVNRSMSRKALTEFEMRVVFQMSANDSASLIDSPKASNLGLHRALYYNEQAGTLETFRPYAAPDSAWLAAAAKRLQDPKRIQAATPESKATAG